MALSFSHAILAWARTKPADESYRYVDWSNCAICQFLRDTGRAQTPRVAGNEWRDGPDGKWHEFDSRVDAAANSGVPAKNTFGLFADRLEAELVK